MGMSRTANVGDEQRLNQAVYMWFKQKRIKGVSVSRPMLCEKAVELSKILNDEGAKFYVKEGCKWWYLQLICAGRETSCE